MRRGTRGGGGRGGVRRGIGGGRGRGRWGRRRRRTSLGERDAVRHGKHGRGPRIARHCLFVGLRREANTDGRTDRTDRESACVLACVRALQRPVGMGEEEVETNDGQAWRS